MITVGIQGTGGCLSGLPIPGNTVPTLGGDEGAGIPSPEELAKPAIQAVEEGTIRFHPHHYTLSDSWDVLLRARNHVSRLIAYRTRPAPYPCPTLPHQVMSRLRVVGLLVNSAHTLLYRRIAFSPLLWFVQTSRIRRMCPFEYASK